MTFSVVAYDSKNGQWGVGVASRFIAVGSVVPWSLAGAGAIATQAWANISYGPDGLRLLRDHSAEETARSLLEKDGERDFRQLGIVDAAGRSYTYTGKKCLDFAGGIAGESFAVQGNILAGREVIEGMASAMEKEGRLIDRILSALRNAEDAGGDRRGKQSAAILITSDSGTYDSNTDRVYDIRVDEHSEPVQELARIAGLWDATFFRDEMVPI